MAEGTLSQAEIDKLIAQKSQGAVAAEPAETGASLPKKGSSAIKSKIEAAPTLAKSAPSSESAVPSREADTDSSGENVSGAMPVVMRTDASPTPGPATPANLEAIISPLQSAIEALSNRVQNAEANLLKVTMLEKSVAANSSSASQNSKQTMERIFQLEQEVINLKNVLQTLSAELQNAVSGFSGLAVQVNEINRGLQGTIGYDIQQNFTCQNCGSHGYVAGLVKCTECEEEDWWGWWPPEE